MNARALPASERGLILLVAISLLASGVILHFTAERPSVSPTGSPIVLDEVLVVLPAFLDARTVDLNTASASELVRLPGIGEVLAGRIIAYREERGGFSSIEDLLAVSGIGPAILESIRELVTLEPQADRTVDGQ